MLTLQHILDWCEARKQEGKIFEDWTREDLMREIIRRVSNKELVIYSLGMEIYGAIAFTILNKEVRVDNIVTVAPNVLGKMFRTILSLHNIPLTGEWKMTGTHRTGRPRAFPMTPRFMNMLDKCNTFKL